MFTVVPSARSRLKVSPAGTVNELMLTVVHSTASSTSSREEMVPVQAVPCLVPRIQGMAAAKITNAALNISERIARP